MSVLKRDGTIQNVCPQKLVVRLQNVTKDLPGVNAGKVAESVAEFIHDGIRTDELDNFIASSCSSLIIDHPDYDTLATRIAVNRLHKNTDPSFVQTMRTLAAVGRVSKDLLAFAERWKSRIEAAIDMSRDYDFDFFGFRTLERSYLLSVSPDKPPAERPQYLYMRVAIGIHGAVYNDIERVLNTYDLLSRKMFVHATPTLFNAGTNLQQLSSCYLLEIESDSIDGIFNTIHESALISKSAGGLGINVAKMRAAGTPIASTGGTSTGIIPALRIMNETAAYVDQGGRRSGSCAIYLPSWHADVESFIDLRRNGGHVDQRCRNLFIALVVPDIFMRRVAADGQWSLFCPHRAPGLNEAYGEDFDMLYERYEADGIATRSMRAKDLWASILTAQIETGTPYMAYQSAIQKSNQSHLGVIQSSNLCIEVMQYCSPEETAVCNLLSICLPKYVKYNPRGTPEFDFDLFESVVETGVINLNRVIDINLYPSPKARLSNFRHRPIGMGVQGLADLFAMMGLSFVDEESYELEKKVFQSFYYAAVKTSIELARKHASEEPANDVEARERDPQWPGAHVSFRGSPMQNGVLNPDMYADVDYGFRHDWDALRADAKKWGVRNSLLIALMPTASTSQICGYNECFEPFSSAMYKRKTMAGEFIVINKLLTKELIKRGLWNADVSREIILNDGSVKGLACIPEDLQRIFMSSFDVPQKHVILHAANRQKFVDQSQSMNVFMRSPTLETMTRMHFYGWRAGLKTGMYYCRTQVKQRPQRLTIDPELEAAKKAEKQRQEEEEGCIMCSS